MKAIAGLAVLCLLVACEDKPPARTTFDPQVQALEKARNVEKQVQQAGQQRAEEVERATAPGY